MRFDACNQTSGCMATTKTVGALILIFFLQAKSFTKLVENQYGKADR
jgi:hypothetical protein